MSDKFHHIQNLTPKPRIDQFIAAMMGKEYLKYSPTVEFIVDEPVIKTILSGMFQREWVTPAGDRESQKRYLDNLIFFWYRMGYDMMRFESAPVYPGSARVAVNTAGAAGLTRSWVEESMG